MTKLLQEPIARSWTEPRRGVGQPSGVSVTPKRPPPARALRDTLQAAGEFVAGWILGVLIVAVQLLLYACAVLAVPVLPFLLPLGLFPVAILAAAFIVGIGKGLAAVGVGHSWL